MSKTHINAANIKQYFLSANFFAKNFLSDPNRVCNPARVTTFLNIFIFRNKLVPCNTFFGEQNTWLI